MGVLKGDFIGFTIGDYHSSDLGIIRASDGSRFNENLLPNFSDKTAKIPGRDETLYFRTEYDKKEFPISFAFDSLSESQLLLLKKVLGKKELQNLIFDEYPYKIYKVKAASPPNLKFICFEENNERVYKGEGSVTFVAYYPFAKSRFKYKEDYNYLTIPEWKYAIDNKDEWLLASGIRGRNEFSNTADKIPYGAFICTQLRYNLTENTGEEQIIISDGMDKEEVLENLPEDAGFYSFGGEFKTRLYNPGDLETYFKLIVNSAGYGYSLFYSIDLKIQDKGKLIGQLTVERIPSDDYGFIFNGYNHLIECTNSSGEKNGKILNQYIKKGEFFKIPITRSSKVEDLPILIIDVKIEEADGNLTKEDITLLPPLLSDTSAFSITTEDTFSYEYDYLYY